MWKWLVVAVVTLLPPPALSASAPATVVTVDSIAKLGNIPIAATTSVLSQVAPFGLFVGQSSSCVANSLPNDGLSCKNSVDGNSWRSILAPNFPASFPGSLPFDVMTINIGNYLTAWEIPAAVPQGFVSKMVIPTTYTQAPWPPTNFSGYCWNQNNTGIGAPCVPFFSLATTTGGASSAVYHSNGIVSNAPPQYAISGTGHGTNFGALIGSEMNPNDWTGVLIRTTTGNTHTSTTIDNLGSVVGLVPGQTVAGAGVVTGTQIVSVGASSVVVDHATTASATGVSVSFYTTTTGDIDAYRAVGGGDVKSVGVSTAYHAFGLSFNAIPWDFGYKGQDACCVVGADYGALGVAGNNVNSQGVNFHAYNSVGANVTATLQHASTGGVGGIFQLSVPSSGKFGFIVNNITKTEIGAISFNWLDTVASSIAFNTDITTVSNTLPEFGGQFLLRSATGFANKSTAYKVALAAWGKCTAGTANCYGANFITTMGAGAGNVLETTLELNTNNNNQAYTSASFGAAAASYGLVIANGGTFRSTAAIWVTDPTATAKLWAVGAGFTADSISEYTIFDGTSSTVHDRIEGTHTTGIDGSAATLTNFLVGPGSTSSVTGAGAGTFSALRTTGTSFVFQQGGVTGTLVWAPATSNKTITLPNGTTDFTATSGIVQQASSGAAFTVGTVSNANLANSSTTVNGQTCTLGSTCTITATATSVTIGTTTIGSGTNGRLLYDNSAVLGEAVTGTAVLTALGVNVGSAGAFVVNGGALGTPSGGTLTNATGLPLSGLVSQVTNTVVGNATSGSASPTALAVGSCSTASSALIWTTNTGFGCNTSITAAAAPASGLTGATLAAGVTASSLASVGTTLSLGATAFAAKSGDYIILYDTVTNQAITIGSTSDPSIYYRDTKHVFGNIGGGTTFLDYNGTTASTWTSTQAWTWSNATLKMTALATDAATTDSTMCVKSSDGTILKGSGTLGICLGTSSELFKPDLRPLVVGLPELMRLRPIQFHYDTAHDFGAGKLYYGFGAWATVYVLPSLVDRAADGSPQSQDVLGVVPVIVNAMQEKVANDNQRFDAIERKIGMMR